MSFTSSPEEGYAAFCAVKLVGYTVAAQVLAKVYAKKDAKVLLAGLFRTLLGMAVGAGVYGLSSWATNRGPGWEELYLLCLIPIRFGEWWLLVWLFFDRPLAHPGQGWAAVGAGTVWSFVLDVPATMSWFLAGEFTIC